MILYQYQPGPLPPQDYYEYQIQVDKKGNALFSFYPGYKDQTKTVWTRELHIGFYNPWKKVYKACHRLKKENDDKPQIETAVGGPQRQLTLWPKAPIQVSVDHPDFKTIVQWLDELFAIDVISFKIRKDAKDPKDCLCYRQSTPSGTLYFPDRCADGGWLTIYKKQSGDYETHHFCYCNSCGQKWVCHQVDTGHWSGSEYRWSKN